MSHRADTKLLKEYVNRLLEEAESQRGLRIFDFDDTLVKTDAKIIVTHSDGIVDELTSGEYATYVAQLGDIFDFSQFQQLINPKQIKWTTKILKSVYERYGPEGLVILTARGSSEPIVQFLNDAGLPGVEIINLGTGKPSAKSNWILQRIKKQHLTLVEFFDDSEKNVEAVLSLRNKRIKVSVEQASNGYNTVWLCRLTINARETH